MSDHKDTNKESTINSDDDLYALVDGQLDGEREAAAKRYLEANADKQRDVEEWSRQNEAIKALYDHVESEEIPERLRPANIYQRNRYNLSAWQSMAAALILFLAGGLSGWLIKGDLAVEPSVTQAFIRNALMAHAVYSEEIIHPVEVSAREESHLVNWLSKRLQRKIIVPDLSQAGFSLVGGRLLPGVERMAAQFMYEDDEGRRITLYTMRSETGQLAAFRFKSEGNYQTFYWQDEEISYAIVGDITRDTLKGLAHRVYRQLS